MKNIHLIPTPNPSRLYINKRVNELTLQGVPLVDENANCKNQHIYITNDEKPKEGDWYLYKGTAKKKIYLKNNLHYDCKKIILTTDQDLVKDRIQAIDDNFLEWFVKNPSCKYVKTDLVPVNEFGSEITVTSYGFDKFKYKIIFPQEEPKNTCPKCRTTDFDDCHSIKCPMRKEEPKQEWLKNAKWGVRLTKDNQPDFTYVDQWFEGKLFKRDMLKLVYPDSPSFSYSSWKVFDTKELAEEWIKVPKEETKQENCCTPIGQIKRYVDCKGCDRKPKQNSNFYAALSFAFSEKLKQYFEETPREKILEDWAKSAEFDNVGPTVDDFLNNTNKQRVNLQSLESELDEVLSKETEESLTTWLDEKRSKQEMRLVNIEAYDTKVYTFRNEEGELYHVIKQDSFLNNMYPEYRFIGPDQKEVADDESINEIKKVMENWEK